LNLLTLNGNHTDSSVPLKQGDTQYRIAWERKINGPGRGIGTKVFSLNEAVDTAIELNTEYPDFHHYVVPE
jgi:hypothetical protein